MVVNYINLSKKVKELLILYWIKFQYQRFIYLYPKDIKSENIENGSFNNTGKYSYCGPGTKLDKRVTQGYKGINDLDKACLEHDIAYDKNRDTQQRNIADNE